MNEDEYDDDEIDHEKWWERDGVFPCPPDDPSLEPRPGDIRVTVVLRPSPTTLRILRDAAESEDMTQDFVDALHHFLSHLLHSPSGNMGLSVIGAWQTHAIPNGGNLLIDDAECRRRYERNCERMREAERTGMPAAELEAVTPLPVLEDDPSQQGSS